jgi:hypothetical protein
MNCPQRGSYNSYVNRKVVLYRSAHTTTTSWKLGNLQVMEPCEGNAHSSLKLRTMQNTSTPANLFNFPWADFGATDMTKKGQVVIRLTMHDHMWT